MSIFDSAGNLPPPYGQALGDLDNPRDLLNQPLRNFVHTGYLLMPDYTQIADVLELALPGQIVAVSNDSRSPVAVTSEDRLRKLPEPSDRLRNHYNTFAAAAFTAGDTRVGAAIQNMLTDPLIRWYVLMDGDVPLGVVSSTALIEILPRVTRERPLTRPLIVSLFETWGIGTTGTSTQCYRCDASPFHDLLWEDIKDQNPDPGADYTCPYDDEPVKAVEC
jgi:hypothetical protein